MRYLDIGSRPAIIDGYMKRQVFQVISKVVEMHFLPAFESDRYNPQGSATHAYIPAGCRIIKFHVWSQLANKILKAGDQELVAP